MVKNSGAGVAETCIQILAPHHELADPALLSEFLGLNLYVSKMEITIPPSKVNEMLYGKHLAHGLAFRECSAIVIIIILT